MMISENAFHGQFGDAEDFAGFFDCFGCLNVFGMAAAVDGACSGFLVKAGTGTLPDLQAR